MKHSALCIAFALSLFVMQAEARADDGKMAVPSAMQGVWGKWGRCDVEADRLKITADAAGFGTDALKPVSYGAEDKAASWDEEYETDNFVVGINFNYLVYNSQGFHMPGAVGYARCGKDLARVPWPWKHVGAE